MDSKSSSRKRVGVRFPPSVLGFSPVLFEDGAYFLECDKQMQIIQAKPT